MEANKFSLIASKVVGTLFGNGLNFRLKYYHNRGHFPNFKHPKDLAEFMLGNMLTSKFDEYSPYADKVRVRDFVKERGLENILLKHYGVWENPEDIDWDKLPNKFILKANNGCGDHVICKDKNKLDKHRAIETLKRNMKNGQHSAERHYRAIKPLCFAEELLDTGTDEWPTDYKLMCINGEPDHFFIATERAVSARYDTYDFNWERVPYTKKNFFPHVIPAKPQHINELVEYARTLSKGFPVVRADFYEFDGKIFFSELTFSPWGGFLYSYTDQSIIEMGKKMGLK